MSRPKFQVEYTRVCLGKDTSCKPISPRILFGVYGGAKFQRKIDQTFLAFGGLLSLGPRTYQNLNPRITLSCHPATYSRNNQTDIYYSFAKTRLPVLVPKNKQNLLKYLPLRMVDFMCRSKGHVTAVTCAKMWGPTTPLREI